jgi:hypothetical protein
MSGIQRICILSGCLAILSCAAGYLKSMHDLQAARQELRSVAEANEFLKKTLGEMTVAIASKDREIDRLEQAGCDGQPKAPPAAHAAPHPGKVSE